MKERKFEFGELTATRAVLEMAEDDPVFSSFIDTCFIRHVCGDWGELCDEDKDINEDALKNGDRLLSSYTFENTGEKIWIITEADRSITTILFPSDY